MSAAPGASASRISTPAVDYAGKMVVDAGCNVGILAYEISKRGAAFIHALDGSPQMLAAAKLIFRSVDTPHRLDLVDLANDRRLREVLRPAYDIVQLLAVYQHVERARGDALARRMLATLAERCTETFVVASNPAYLPAITETLTASRLPPLSLRASPCRFPLALRTRSRYRPGA